MQKKISFRIVRDLGGIFNAAFGFCKQNFGAFFGSLLFMAGPFILIGGTVSSVMFSSMNTFAMFGRYSARSPMFGSFLIFYFITILVMLIGVSVFTVILNKNIIENEMLEEGERLTARRVISGFFLHYWRVLGNMLLFALVSVVLFFFLALVLSGILSLFNDFLSSGLGVGIFMVFLFFIGSLIVIPVLAYIPVAALFVCQRDNINIFSAIRRVMYYMKSNFWSTWLVSFIALVTYVVMAFIVQLPSIILNVVSVFSRVDASMGASVTGANGVSLVLVVVNVICTLLGFGAMSVYQLMNIYQYTSLEEKREGLAVLEKINNIE